MVDATISYLAAMPERPFFFLYDPPPCTPWRNTPGRPMPIRNARQLDPPPSREIRRTRTGRHHQSALAPDRPLPSHHPPA